MVTVASNDRRRHFTAPVAVVLLVVVGAIVALPIVLVLLVFIGQGRARRGETRMSASAALTRMCTQSTTILCYVKEV